jgi:circadian clock protein KaiC
VKKVVAPSCVRKSDFAKCPTGIRGLDEITYGGLPLGRPTLISGGPGTGKTLFGLEFLVRGAIDHDEPGVFISFEERPSELAKNSASLGFDLQALVKRKKLLVEQIAVDCNELVEAGEYSLDGLFIRLGAAIDSMGAKRVVLDTIEVLFAALSDVAIVRSELRRLFDWLKDKGVTTIVTGERGEGTLTRGGLEEYVCDCVILLDQRVSEQIATRRLRIIKYRGSLHGTNEYPFLIDDQGFLVLPITAVALDYSAHDEFVSTGINDLDAMLENRGYFRGTTVMMSGAAGTGKSSLSAHFVDATCARGERCIYFAFEESPEQIMRNMRSIGIDLQKWVKRGLLLFSAVRPATFGLEMHISMMLKLVDEVRPNAVVLDPVSSFEDAGTPRDAHVMLMRAIDILKARQITTVFTSLTPGGDTSEQTAVGVSSLIDTWLLVRNIEQNGMRTRGLYVLKSRGMNHSNAVRELLITNHGIQLEDVYLGPDGILVGAARIARQAQDRAEAAASMAGIEHKHGMLERKRAALKAKVAELESEFNAEAHDIEQAIRQERGRQETLLASRVLPQRRGVAKASVSRSHAGATK